jgi:hypothetical protein
MVFAGSLFMVGAARLQLEKRCEPSHHARISSYERRCALDKKVPCPKWNRADRVRFTIQSGRRCPLPVRKLCGMAG